MFLYSEQKPTIDFRSSAWDLQKRNDSLQEENNLLKLKVEVLLDMLAQKTAEAETYESDIMKLRNILANS